MNIHYDGNLLTIALTVNYRGQMMQITEVIVDLDKLELRLPESIS